jgi:hypothetical protein
MKNYFLVIGALLLLLPGAAYAKKTPARRPDTSRTAASDKDNSDLALEKKKFQLEVQKFASDAEAENTRLSIEREKLNADLAVAKWSKVSSVVPLVVALLTIIYGVWTFNKQGKQQTAAQADAARLQFELKAAEIAFAGKTPEAVMNRAKALSAVFPDRLPSDFLSSFDPQKFGGGKQDPAGKKCFLELLTKCSSPQDKAEMVSLWKALFADDWLHGVESLLVKDVTSAGK